MNKENIIRSANYELVAKYLSIDPSQVKNYFNYAGGKKRNIENPVDLSNFIDKYELRGPGIYCIENTRNGRKYIGQSAIILDRKKSHYSLLRSNKHNNKDLQDDFNLFWEENFIFSVLEFCKDKNTLMEVEKKHIKNYDIRMLYNSSVYFLSDDIEYIKLCIDRKADIVKFLASTS